MVSYSYREGGPLDVEGLLEVRNAIFPPVTAGEWNAEPNLTSSLALDGGRIVGVIPLSLRDFRAGPGLILRTAFENSVGTLEELRGKGVGSGMIASAAEFLKGRCDALYLHRTAERSDGYRFYMKTGHHDLHYMRALRLEQPRMEKEESVTVFEGKSEVIAREKSLLDVFESAYAGFGGFRNRCPGYYSIALNSIIYSARPHHFWLLALEQEGALAGYAIVGIPYRVRVENVVQVMEFATRDRSGASASALLRGISAFAAERGASVGFTTSGSSPYYDQLVDFGFAEAPRSPMILGRFLDPLATAARLIPRGLLPEGVKLDIWTPSVDGAIHIPEGVSSRTILLEMKDHTLARLLSRRIDFEQALRMELITACGLRDGDIAGLSAAFPFAPWIYHAIDYI